MERLRRWLATPWGELLALAGLTSVALLGFRFAGLIEPLEFAAYDAFVRLRSAQPAEVPKLSLVTVRERDLQRHGFPIPDQVLAEALENLLRFEPRAIGVDIYRDQPVPPGSQRIAALAGEDRLFWLERMATLGETPVAPPSWSRPEQIGFSDQFVGDRGNVMRRVLLMAWPDDRGTPHVSLSLQLALRHLREDGIGLGPVPGRPECVRLGEATLCPLNGRFGGYARFDAAGFQQLIDYRTAPGAIPAITLQDALDGAVEPALVRGRTLVLGSDAESLHDEFPTPLSEGLLARREMLSGGRMHALVIDQLLRQARGETRPARSLPGWCEALGVLLLATLGTALASRLREPLPLIGAILAGLFGVLALGYGLFTASWWLPVVPASLAFAGATVLAMLQIGMRERREKEEVRQLFALSVGGESRVEALWKERERFMAEGGLRPQLLVVTTLAAELDGFAAAAENLDPLNLVEWLNEYAMRMTAIIEGHGGVIESFAGDHLKADFGIPMPHEQERIDQDARDAMQAALEMGEALAALNERWRERAMPEARIRIGINTGPAVVGSIGSGGQLRYTAVGDTVNVARLLEAFGTESFARQHEVTWRVLLTGATLHRLGKMLEATPLGEHELPGRSGSVAIYRALDPKARAKAAPEPLPEQAPPPAPGEPDERFVFISYASENQDLADTVVAFLEAADFRCWIAHRDIRPGRNWSESIVEAIAASRAMVLLLTERANASGQVAREVEQADRHKLVIVPFRVDDVQPSASLAYFLTSTHWLDAFAGAFEKHLPELVKAIEVAGASTSSEAAKR